jgi:hypothetical protein
MNETSGKILLSANTENAAEEFFSLLLHPQNRIIFRQKFQKCKKIIASGTEILGEKEQILLKADTLYLMTHIIATNTYIMYLKKDSANSFFYDKILVWRTFPAEDSYELENTITNFQNQQQDYPFMEICLLLYNGNIQTGATDLKSKSEALKESECVCREKYTNCRVFSIDSESQFLEKINQILPMNIQFQYQMYSSKLLKKLSTIEEDLQEAMEFFSMYCDFPEELFPPEKLEKICSWNQIKNSKNVLKTYFENFKGAYEYHAEYTKLEQYLITFYKKHIAEICIWNLEKDILKLKNKLRNKYSDIQNQYSQNSVPAPENEIDYSKKMYTDLRLQFQKIIINFFEEDSKKIIYMHIIKKIEVYRSKLT